ncbi:MAG: phosphate ABC transporter substrate-binding protein PstS family protein, partial [Actinobacteria bacterium]|nr:phosphate ABC transporter substrate-binding protein PstS family protein [Actinomycetota bacterium]
MKARLFQLLLVLVAFAVIVSGCAQKPAEEKAEKPGKEANQTEETQKKPELEGEVLVDGSSTVYPIAEGIAEEFQNQQQKVKVTIGVSGTGGGMKKFVAGEIDIANASRPIKDEEKAEAEKNGIKFAEFKIAYDGVTIVVNKENNWIDNITVEQLKELWKPDSKIKMWSDINKSYPKQKIVLFGPDTDSGTFEFFTEEIVGEKKKSRSDYTQSADDNVLVEGVAGE